MLLAGDIGGTKTNLAIFQVASSLQMPLAEATFPSNQYTSLEELVEEFLAQVDYKVTRAAFGVAGPVVAGQATITNLPWRINANRLKERFNLASVRLMNDLEAIANAVPFLKQGDLHTLNAGQTAVNGNIAVIAPGTGLGEAFLTWDGVRYHAHASEGGHADFAPTTGRQMGLLRYLQTRCQHVSYERVCSGKGIPNIYDFLKEDGEAEEPTWLAQQLATTDDRTPAIVNAALNKERPSQLCAATLDTFIAILGAEAGNLALKVMASGGIYLGGGILPRILSALKNDQFMSAFQAKGRFASLLKQMPVHIILNPKSALLGAACAGLELFHV